jgi:hypothetical protein
MRPAFVAPLTALLCQYEETSHKVTQSLCQGYWLAPEKAFILYGGEEHYPVREGIEAIGLRGLCDILAGIG